MKIPVVLPPELRGIMQATTTVTTAQETFSDPGFEIAEAGTTISDTYARYRELRALIQVINGLPENAPLPEELSLREITISYSVAGVDRQAVVRKIQRVGDLFNLLSRDIEESINILRGAALKAKEAAEGVETACSRAQYTANARQNPVTP